MAEDTFSDLGRIEAIARLYEGTPFKPFQSSRFETSGKSFITSHSRTFIEGIDFDAVNVSPRVVKTYLFHYDYAVAESYAFVVSVSVATFVFFTEEHLLTFVPHGNVNSWIAKRWQNLVEQVFVDRFC